MVSVFSASAEAAPGDLDPSFDSNGLILNPEPLPSGGAVFENAIVVQRDDSSVISTGSSVIRFTEAGGRDLAFNARAEQAFAGIGPSALVLDLASDEADRILALVLVRPPDPAPRMTVLVRMLTDGSLDASFAANGLAEVSEDVALGTVAVNAAGQIGLAVGNELVRLLPDGEPDPAFSSDGRVVGAEDFNAMALRADGSVLGLKDDALLQFHPDGVLNAGFGQAGIVELAPSPINRTASEVVVDSAGASYVHMTACIPDFIPRCGSSVRSFAPDGSPRYTSTSFDGGSRYNMIDPNVIAVDSLGRVILAHPHGGDAYVSRLSSNGRLDGSFGGGDGSIAVHPGGCNAGSQSVAVDRSDRPLIDGFACNRGGVVRLRTAPGPANLDADPFLEKRDRCPRFPSRRHEGCGVQRRSLKVLEASVGHLRGTIRDAGSPPSDEPLRLPPPTIFVPPVCGVEVPVKLFRQTRGDDRLVDRTRSGRRGKWGFNKPPPGRLYVRTPAIFTDDEYCAPAKLRAELSSRR